MHLHNTFVKRSTKVSLIMPEDTICYIFSDLVNPIAHFPQQIHLPDLSAFFTHPLHFGNII